MGTRKKATLSELDRKLLNILLTPNGRISSKSIAAKLGIPVTTIQRRRKRLEKDYLVQTYTLNLQQFDWHKVDFLIATDSGKTDALAKSLLKREEVIYAGKSIGEHTIDLKIETILKNNSEILRMMELLKATPGIKDVVWMEIVEVAGRKTSIPTQIIDQL